MPELPEVQTVVSELQKKIKNKKIKEVRVRAAKVALPSVKILIAKLKNKKIHGVSRRGKMIIIDLGGDHNILIHLKMTGQLVYVSKSGKKVSGGHPIGNVGILPNKFSHVIIKFTDGSVLYFNDIRKFGWVKYVDNARRDLAKQKYGIEPFDKEYKIDWLGSLLKRYKNKKIKQLLMDQEKIAGIGNIYADESLFAAGVLPTRTSGSLKKAEISKLFEAIPKILKLAITKGGTSADNYVRTDGTQGGMMKYLKVYGRKGKKCRRCGGRVKKIKLGGRGTHFCPACQK
ncbi:MAG: bifunctional DNA-formamidopyrimidine glycosylase/DNA-(apurinic or apyrimidinic site) lyase [Patescibacteria group bacterium]